MYTYMHTCYIHIHYVYRTDRTEAHPADQEQGKSGELTGYTILYYTIRYNTIL